MPPVAKRAPVKIIGVAGLMCLDAALIAYGWMEAADVASIDGPIADGDWTPPPFDAPTPTSGQSAEPARDDPVLARPIFFATRRPFEPPPAPVAAKPPPPPLADPGLVVDGVILAGGARKAHVRRPPDVDGHWHEAGQVIDGWTIAEIDAAGIVLEQAGRRLAIGLYPTDSRAFKVERLPSRPAKLR